MGSTVESSVMRFLASKMTAHTDAAVYAFDVGRMTSALRNARIVTDREHMSVCNDGE